MKWFISQPMRDKSDDEILKERTKAIKKIKVIDKNCEIIESFFEDFKPDAKPLEYLAESIRLLAEADRAVFLSGWNNTRGCKVEHYCSVLYGIECLEEDDLDEC